MSSLSRELVFLILQFLDEEKFKETVHRLRSSLEVTQKESLVLLSRICLMCLFHLELMLSDGWDKQRSKSLQIPSDSVATFSDTCIQFHQDHIHLLAVHEAQIAIYNAAKLECLKHSNVYPLVIAAHPSDPNQFAIGLTDGAVHILEPLESEGNWGLPTPAENGTTSRASPRPPSEASSDEHQK